MRTYGEFTANIFGNSDIPNYKIHINTGDLVEVASSFGIANGYLGVSSPRFVTANYDFYPYKEC